MGILEEPATEVEYALLHEELILLGLDLSPSDARFPAQRVVGRYAAMVVVLPHDLFAGFRVASKVGCENAPGIAIAVPLSLNDKVVDHRVLQFFRSQERDDEIKTLVPIRISPLINSVALEVPPLPLFDECQ